MLIRRYTQLSFVKKFTVSTLPFPIMTISFKILIISPYAYKFHFEVLKAFPKPYHLILVIISL